MTTTVLFDLDGTLSNSKLGITESIRYALVQMKRPLDPATSLDWCIGPPLADSFATLLQTDEQTAVDEAVSFFRHRFGETGLFENELYAGIPEMLGQLQQDGLRLLVATSKPLVYARRIITHFGLDPFFDGMYGSELNGRLAQKADLIAHVLHSEQLDPAQTCMVGDRRHDMLGAVHNGVRAVGVTYGFGSAEELLAAGADALAESPAMVAEIISSRKAENN